MSEHLEFDSIEDGHVYRALLGGAEVGFSEVDLIASDGLLIKHTEVRPEFEGRGIGGALMRHILESAKKQGRGVIPICPYAAAFIKRNPEYLDYVRENYRAVLAQR